MNAIFDGCANRRLVSGVGEATATVAEMPPHMPRQWTLPSKPVASAVSGNVNAVTLMSTGIPLQMTFEKRSRCSPRERYRSNTMAMVRTSNRPRGVTLIQHGSTVTNPSATPVDVVFSSGQRYDFAIISATTGAEVWRWSVGRGFTMAFGQQTLPANGTIVFVDTWKPTVKGNLVAVGSLVSASHRAEGKVQLTIP